MPPAASMPALCTCTGKIAFAAPCAPGVLYACSVPPASSIGAQSHTRPAIPFQLNDTDLASPAALLVKLHETRFHLSCFFTVAHEVQCRHPAADSVLSAVYMRMLILFSALT